MVASLCQRLLFVGWLGLEGETNWYGIWRRKFRTGFAAPTASSSKGKQKEDAVPWASRGRPLDGDLEPAGEYEIRPVVDGDLFRLEEEMLVRPPMLCAFSRLICLALTALGIARGRIGSHQPSHERQ